MLTELELCGYKTIKTLESLKLGPMNVLIGANGAGKSNLISFFTMLSWMMNSPGELQAYIGRFGGANSILHDGAAITRELRARLTFEASDHRKNEFQFRLFHAAGDTLIFADEQARYTPADWPEEKERAWVSYDAGHREARIVNAAEQGEGTAGFIHSIMKNCVVHQFHDTSETARIRQKWQLDDNYYLKRDGANLASFLFRLQKTQNRYYLRIVEKIRQVAPYFADFVFNPIGGSVMLQWRERNSDLIFGPHQISDGALRFMALVSLLLQPEETIPKVLILDEPELGLHPFAIDIIAGLLKSASTHTQIILATQSMALIDYFEPHQVIVVDRPDRESLFRRLEESHLREWLEDYSLSELWEKNVIGGRPSR